MFCCKKLDSFQNHPSVSLFGHVNVTDALRLSTAICVADM